MLAVLLLSGLVLFFKKGLKMDDVPSFIWALVIGAALFSLFHYVGELGDPFELDSFLFRWIAGGILGAIYLCRGLGIAVYTHAIYDILVVL